MIEIDNYVTGASGFIGKRLCSLLSIKTISIPHAEIGRFHIEEFRRFFFLSTYGNMAQHHNSADILRANVLDLGRILEHVIRFQFSCESFVFVSSSSVGLPVHTPYSRTKSAAEQMILSMPLPGCIVRLFSVTGVGEQPAHLIPTLIRSCFEGTPVDLAPDPVHDFIDVQDVASGLLALADNKATGIFEFGSGTPTSNAQVLDMVEGFCDLKANVRIVKQIREYDNKEWYCKNVAPRESGLICRKSLPQSISEMVDAYRRERA